MSRKRAGKKKVTKIETLVDTKDIRKIDLVKLQQDIGYKRVDVIIGGPPCQGFSSLRPNRSTNNDDERNNLFIQYAKFVDKFRPKIFVIEKTSSVTLLSKTRLAPKGSGKRFTMHVPDKC